MVVANQRPDKIAEKLGRSLSAVKMRAHHLRIMLGRVTRK